MFTQAYYYVNIKVFENILEAVSCIQTIGTKNCQVFFVTVCLTCRRLDFETQFIFVNCTEFLYKKCLWQLPVMERAKKGKRLR